MGIPKILFPKFYVRNTPIIKLLKVILNSLQSCSSLSLSCLKIFLTSKGTKVQSFLSNRFSFSLCNTSSTGFIPFFMGKIVLLKKLKVQFNLLIIKKRFLLSKLDTFLVIWNTFSILGKLVKSFQKSASEIGIMCFRAANPLQKKKIHKFLLVSFVLLYIVSVEVLVNIDKSFYFKVEDINCSFGTIVDIHYS